MTFQMNQPIPCQNGYCYTSVSYHRDGSSGKSQWIITIEEECNCFINAVTHHWIIKNSIGWGVKMDSTITLEIVGRNINGESLKFAKFIGDRNNWHGYPADYRRKTEDIPLISILLKWQKLGFIKKHHISKIRSGKICSL